MPELQESYGLSLPPTNPLSNFRFWSPDGKHVSGLDAAEYALQFFKRMEQELPCSENNECIWHLQQVIKLQQLRHQARLEQKLLGTKLPHKRIDPTAWMVEPA